MLAAFAKRVREVVQKIPRGQTRSYAEIAGILAERPHLAAVAQAELGTKLNAYGYMDPRFYLAKFLPKTRMGKSLFHQQYQR
jgi:hypothetical protein